MLALSAGELNVISAGVLQIGSAAAGSITVSAAIQPSSTSVLSLISGGSVSEPATGSLTVLSLAVSTVGPAVLTQGNNVGTLAAQVTGGGQFAFSNAAALGVGAVDGVVGVSAASGGVTLSAAGVLTIGAAVTATTYNPIALSTTGGGSDVLVQAAVATGSGNITVSSGGAVTESGVGSFATTGALSTNSTTGQTLSGAGTNAVGGFTAGNTTSGGISLTDAVATLTVTGVAETGGGVTVTNTGNLTTSGAVVDATAGNAIDLTATTGVLTIGAAVTGTTTDAINLTATGGSNAIVLNVSSQTAVSSIGGMVSLSSPGGVTANLYAGNLSGAYPLIVTDGFTASGLSLTLTLNAAPTAGRRITLIRNTGPAISGAFTGLPDDSVISLSNNGTSYSFFTSYSGGAGHDAVLTSFTLGQTAPRGAIPTDVPLFTWVPLTGGVSEELAVVDLSTGGNLVLLVPIPSGTAYQLPKSQALLLGHYYTWYIGAVSSTGAIAWSGGTNFYVEPLASPTPIAPAGTIMTSTGYDTPTFTWSNVPYAVNYYLYVQDAYTGAVVIANATLTGTSYAPGPLLLAGHRYTWWIGSEAAAGGLGGISWSGAVNFTLAPLATPSNLATNFSGSTPTLNWDSVPGAAAYRLYVVDAITGAVLVDNSSLAVPSFAITGGLTSGHRYTWYVAALGADGAAGPNSGAGRATSSPRNSAGGEWRAAFARPLTRRQGSFACSHRFFVLLFSVPLWFLLFLLRAPHFSPRYLVLAFIRTSSSSSVRLSLPCSLIFFSTSSTRSASASAPGRRGAPAPPAVAAPARPGGSTCVWAGVSAGRPPQTVLPGAGPFSSTRTRTPARRGGRRGRRP